jgi:hypothetical protein
MRIPSHPELHLTYCQNIHPAETWAAHADALQHKALAVKNALGVSGPFGLGLRLGANAAQELEAPRLRAEGEALFQALGFYPFSVNGFPYGRFHQGPVKEQVYAPDWRTPERLEYTLRIARTLASWLPQHQDGSISTVPGSFAPWIQSEADRLLIASNLGRAAAALAQIEKETGRYVHLGLEPEPDCFLETTPQTLDFFAHTLPKGALPVLQTELQVSPGEAERLLRRHIGVCFDTCHVALQFENLHDSLRAYQNAGVLLSKIQLSAALQAPLTPKTLEALRRFSEPTYLHQLKARDANGQIHAWSDLPQALHTLETAPPDASIQEVRVHFHVPLFLAPQAPLQSTASALDAPFWNALKEGACSHLEIETYTFDVLPAEVHPGDIVRSIESEYRWVLERLS